MSDKLTLLQFMQALGNAITQAASSLETDPTQPQNDGNMPNMFQEEPTSFDQHFDDVYQPLNKVTEYDPTRSASVPVVSYSFVTQEEEETDVKLKREEQDPNDPDAFSNEQNGENNPLDDDQDDTMDEFGNDDQDNLNDSNDPDRQGDVRYVDDAHLVYKRQQEDGTFEELWIFNIGPDAERRSDFIIKDILAGTDIPENEISSDDGNQDYVTWSVGNIQMVKVRGLQQ